VAVVVAVPMLAEAAETVTVPEAVSVPEKVLLPAKGLRAREDRQLARGVRQREGPRRAGGDPRQRKQRLLRRIGVVDEAEDRVRDVLRHANGIPCSSIPDHKCSLIRDPDQPALSRH